jgi:formylglycine-generating enzyme required for sulfatase activity
MERSITTSFTTQASLTHLLWVFVAVVQGVVAETPGPLGAILEGTQLTVSWDSTPGRYYELHSTTNLGTGWQTVATQPMPLIATSNRFSYTLNAALDRQFFRVAELETLARTGMVWIPAGTFTMGSPANEEDRDQAEGPQMTVTISRGFWIGQYEVTQAEYMTVMGYNPSRTLGDSNRPVEMVDWESATNYCARLTHQERWAGRIPTNWLYRLPTEAEWEYACRAGTTTRFSFGDDPGYGTNFMNYAWCWENSASTYPVGEKLPNPWGLYDMYGNVREWCLDFYGEYPGGVAVDPQGPATGWYRVLRGGSRSSLKRECRSASRYGYPPLAQVNDFGFRILLTTEQPPEAEAQRDVIVTRIQDGEL